MYAKSVLLYAVTLVWVANCVPLNINLGAYSPALVVGDGAISFGGEEEAAAGGEAVVETPGAEAPAAEPAPATEGAATVDTTGNLESSGTSDLPVIASEVSQVQGHFVHAFIFM